MNPTGPWCNRAGGLMALALLVGSLCACNSQEADVAALRKKGLDGDVKAQASLAWMYFTGQNVAKDLPEAARWYRRAADQNDPVAQFNLGSMSAKGLGGERDLAEAARWYRRAAELGHADAQANLGVLYANGEGVTKDDAEAVKWYRRAADQGSSQGQLNLGVMYVSGRGVERDMVEAYKFWALAAAQGEKKGEKKGEEFRDGVAKVLTPGQLAEARRRVEAASAKKKPVTEKETPRQN